MPASRMNVALATNGAVATASTTINSSFPPSGAIDGNRTTLQWASGGGWNSNGAVPQWLQVDFDQAYAISEINVFTYGSLTTPTLSTTSNVTSFGIKDFSVEYWDGAAWQVISSVTNNTFVWRQFTFSPITTTKIRVYVTNTYDGTSRILEVEAITTTGITPRLLLAESFDGFGGDNGQWNRKWTRSSSTLSASHPKTGAYGAGFGPNTGFYRTVPISDSAFLVGFWYWWDGTTAPTSPMMLFGETGTAYNGGNAVCGLTNDASGRLLVLSGSTVPGTTRATSAACLTANANNFIQFFYDVQDSGIYVVRCNGTQVLSGSADLAPTGSPAVLRWINTGVENGVGFDSIFVFDHVDATDLVTIDQTVSMFRPSTGNGANTGLTPSTGTDHGALVDESVPNDDTDYNSGGAGVTDTYVFDLSALSGKTIYGLVLTMSAKATSAGTNTIAGVARIGGTDYVGTTQNLTTAYLYYEQVWTVRPSDGAAWSAGASMEFGVRSIASAAANRITAVFLDVVHSDAVTVTGAVRLVGEMRIKTRLTGGVLA
jgi:hypothetical protein